MSYKPLKMQDHFLRSIFAKSFFLFLQGTFPKHFLRMLLKGSLKVKYPSEKVAI